MRATSLSVNFVGGCDARCPFCIASTTWKTGLRDNQRLELALPRALDFARYHGVDTVLVTGSGEPTLHRELLFRVAQEARRLGIPAVELQTNGARLARDPGFRGELAGRGVSTVALSVSSVDPARSAELMGLSFDYLQLAEELDRQGFLVRVSLNLVDADREALLGTSGSAALPVGNANGNPGPSPLASYAETLRARGVRQLTLRALGVPERPEPGEASEEKIRWVRAHALPASALAALEAQVRKDGTPLRALPYGALVFDFHGLSMVLTTCMTEAPGRDEIRSLILQPDGHVYHSWSYRGSILI